MRESAALLSALLVACCGCGKAPIPGEDVTVTTKGNGAAEMTVKTKDKEGDLKIGVGATGSVKLPDGWPNDVPIKDGSTIGTTMRQGKMQTVSIILKGTVAEAAAYYQAQLKKEGWAVEDALIMGANTMFSGKKAKRECTVMIQEDKGIATAMITVNEGD